MVPKSERIFPQRRCRTFEGWRSVGGVGGLNAGPAGFERSQVASGGGFPSADAEPGIPVLERVPSEGRGKPAQFIPIRLVFTNKLIRDDKLMVAFDALVLSEMLGREVSLGKIIHGDDHTALQVKTSALAGGVRE